MIVFKGGITLSDFMDMPLTEVGVWIEAANRITTEQNKASSTPDTGSASGTVWTS
jgi:hypothetical protein